MDTLLWFKWWSNKFWNVNVVLGVKYALIWRKPIKKIERYRQLRLGIQSGDIACLKRGGAESHPAKSTNTKKEKGRQVNRKSSWYPVEAEPTKTKNFEMSVTLKRTSLVRDLVSREQPVDTGNVCRTGKSI